MGQPNEKNNNNEQVKQVEIDVWKWKNTAGLTAMGILTIAAPALLAATIASILLFAKVFAVAVLPASLGFLAFFANPIAILVLFSTFVYCTANAVSLHQQMSKNEKLALGIEETQKLAKGAEKVIQQAQEQVLEAGKHALAAQEEAKKAKDTQDATVNAATEAAQTLVNNAGEKLINDQVKRKAEEIAKQKTDAAFELAVNTSKLVAQADFESAMQRKADLTTVTNLLSRVDDKDKGLVS